MVNKLIEATEALEPGDMKVGDLLRDPVAETIDMNGNVVPGLPGAVVSDMASAGYAYIYKIADGDRSVCNNNMLSSQLAQVDPVTKMPIFTLRKPDTDPWRGSIKCYLHKDDPSRSEYDLMGLPVCSKATMPSAYQLANHMRHKHRDEWAAIEHIREEAERLEDRAIQRQLRMALVDQNVDTRTDEEKELAKERMAKVRAAKSK